MYSRTLRIAPGGRPPRTRQMESGAACLSPMPPAASGAADATLGNFRSGVVATSGVRRSSVQRLSRTRILILSRSNKMRLDPSLRCSRGWWDAGALVRINALVATRDRKDLIPTVRLLEG